MLVVCAGLVLVIGCGSVSGAGDSPEAGGGSNGGSASQNGGSGTGGSAGLAAVGNCEQSESNQSLSEATGASFSYDGPALVERSTHDELRLVYPSDQAAVDGVAAPWAHSAFLVQGENEWPIIPLGTELWLTRDPWRYGSVPGGLYFPRLSWAFTLRSHQAGPILAGAAFSADGVQTAAWPLTVLGVSQTASCERSDSCATDRYWSIDFQAETPVTLQPGQQALMRLGGAEYTVRGSAWTTSSRHTCADFEGGSYLSFGLWSRDLESALAGALVRELPRCVVGNAPDVQALMSSELPGSYDGPVFYRGRGSMDADYERFEFATEATAGAAPELHVRVTPGVFTEPEMGREFWLTTTPLSSGNGWLNVLRDPRRGPFWLASVSASLPLSAEDSSAIDSALEVPVTATEACVYGTTQGAMTTHSAGTTSNVSLWDVSFGTAPPTVVGSQSLGEVVLSGNAYGVWASALGTSLVITAYRR
jgi:hypothetical protein